MSEFSGSKSRSRDTQDGAEMGVFGTMEAVPGAGMMMSVRGTGTVDEQLPVANFGFGFNLAPDTNAEVLMMSMGSDVNNKFAFPMIPRDLQYQWPQGNGGVQNPTDPSKRIEFSGDDTHHTDGVHTFGPNKELTVTVAGGDVTLTIGGALTIVANGVEITSPTLTHNGTNVGDSHAHTDTAGLGAGTTSGPF